MTEDAIRLYLHAQLEEQFPDVGLYYMPPGNMILERPCLIYEPQRAEPSFANNSAYVVGLKYQLTLLSDLPGYPCVRKMYQMPAVIVTSSRTIVIEDIVNDIYSVSVHTIT